MEVGVHIGAEKGTIIEARDAILSIAGSYSISDIVKIKALEVLGNICSVNNTTIANCTFKGGE